MIGADGVLRAVAERMEAALTAEVRALRDKTGLPAGDLPDPAAVMSYQPAITTLGDWPAVFTVWTNTDQLDRDLTQPEAGALVENYQFRYTVQVYALVRSDTSDSTERMARLYEQAIRSVVLTRKDITPEWVSEGESVVINPVKVTSEPWDVVQEGDNRFISAVYVEFPVMADEEVGSPFPSSGTAEELPVEPNML